MPRDFPAPKPSAPNMASKEKTPHFDYPGSDIVIHSCDSHNFHVPKLYLVNSSPVLRELIQSVSNTFGFPRCEALPVVKLPECGTTLHNLLTFIFPVASILPSTSEKIMELLAVAQKYQMDSILAHIRCAVSRQDPSFIRPETAFHIYFLAQMHGLHHEAVQAARVTLCLPMTIEDLGDKLNFAGMTGAYLHELWKYHKRVRTDLKSGLLEFRNSGLPEDVKGLRCKYPYGSVSSDESYPRWLDDYIEAIAQAPHLFDRIEFENALTRHIKEAVGSFSKTCSCLDNSSLLRRAFWEALTGVVHGAIEKVDSTLTLVKEEPTRKNPDLSFVPLRLNVPDASIIVRSSDQVNFRVHKSLLAMSSPFFEDLLSLPQPPNEELVDGLPVVQLPEDADLLNSLISLLYPIRHPVVLSSYENVFVLLAACQKYDMASIQSNVRDLVKRGTFPTPVKAQAFSAYAFASSMGLSPEMEHAARLTQGQPLTFESLGEELRSFKGRALCDLVRYRAANKRRSSSWFAAFTRNI